MVILVVGLDSCSDRFQDLGSHGRFVIGIVVLGNEFLDLRRRQDPADVKEDLDIGEVPLDISLE